MKQPTKKPKKTLTIWYNRDGTIEWEGKNLKPSEMCLMGACLQEQALQMCGEMAYIPTRREVCD